MSTGDILGGSPLNILYLPCHIINIHRNRAFVEGRAHKNIKSCISIHNKSKGLNIYLARYNACCSTDYEALSGEHAVSPSVFARVPQVPKARA